MISADNDDNDKHPLLMMIMMMLKKMLIMPAAMNDRKDDDHRQIYGSTNAPHVPPKPRLIAKSKNSLLRLGRILI